MSSLPENPASTTTGITSRFIRLPDLVDADDRAQGLNPSARGFQDGPERSTCEQITEICASPARDIKEHIEKRNYPRLCILSTICIANTGATAGLGFWHPAAAIWAPASGIIAAASYETRMRIHENDIYPNDSCTQTVSMYVCGCSSILSSQLGMVAFPCDRSNLDYALLAMAAFLPTFACNWFVPETQKLSNTCVNAMCCFSSAQASTDQPQSAPPQHGMDSTENAQSGESR